MYILWYARRYLWARTPSDLREIMSSQTFKDSLYIIHIFIVAVVCVADPDATQRRRIEYITHEDLPCTVVIQIHQVHQDSSGFVHGTKINLNYGHQYLPRGNKLEFVK